jgi:hypothetical protein
MLPLDYSNCETTSAIPEATSLIETFRAIGYNFPSAVADIIDNSISASAKNIWLNFEWNGSDTWLSIKDDGAGMNNDELVNAMRPGSRNPLEDRNTKDLGRFGLGLKTASFSQCRKLSVISKKTNHDYVYWTWDLDFVNKTGKWDLIKYIPDDRFADELSELRSGTVVVWNDLDRLVKNLRSDDDRALDKFLQVMENVKKHLAMVFHRFIESGHIKIFFQDRPIESWNPYLLNEITTQGFPEETMQNGKVMIKGFVLPHKSKISPDVFKMAEGPRGWNEQQGFYIYRNQRMLLAGDWLGMFRKEEHYKLARIEVHLPNSLDSDWQIDIKKSVARPPMILRDQLKAYASKVREQAVEVYRHKGKNIKPMPGQKFIPLWVDHKRGNKWFYKLNREHPLISEITTQTKTEPQKAIELLLSFIEETIPAKSIYIKEAEDSELQGKPFESMDHEPIRRTMDQMFKNLISQGKAVEHAKAIILNIEPFNQFPHLLELIN